MTGRTGAGIAAWPGYLPKAADETLPSDAPALGVAGADDAPQGPDMGKVKAEPQAGDNDQPARFVILGL
jgi:hypothetical protein